jgi:hypothetical protein
MLRSAAMLAISTIAVSACSSSPDFNDAASPGIPPAAEDCSKRTPEFSEAFHALHDRYLPEPICVAHVGPGLDGPDIMGQFSSVTAGDLTDLWTSTGHGATTGECWGSSSACSIPAAERTSSPH